MISRFLASLLVFLLICSILIGGCIEIVRTPSSSTPSTQSPTHQISSEQAESITNTYIAALETEMKTEQQQTATATSLLQSSGIPVINVLHINTVDNATVLLVLIDYTKLGTGPAPGYFMTAGQQSLIRIASIKTLNLSGIAYLTAVLQDGKGRMFYEVGAKTADVTAFRDGTLNQQQFASKMASKVTDSAAGMDALNKVTN